jgi:hypothetical protein
VTHATKEANPGVATVAPEHHSVTTMLVPMLRFRALALALATAALSLAHTGNAQQPAPVVGLGFGVDTTDANVGAIVRLVRAYLAAPASARQNRLWEASRDSTDHTRDDLAARYALQGFPTSIVGVVAADAGDSVYVVKLLHARADNASGPVSPLALERLYAVRGAGRPFGWQLSAALPRLTRPWATRSAGRITFHYEPGQTPNQAHIVEAARFVDSVATVFNARPSARINYYVTASPEAYFRALGLDFFVGASGSADRTGGNALPDVGVLLVGDPVQGDLYRHELVHIALAGRVPSVFVGEGIAAWLGGSRGRSARELYRVLADFQRVHPSVTFAALVDDKLSVPSEPVPSSDAWYATGALVCEAVYRRLGVAGLRELAGTPSNPGAVPHVVARLLGIADQQATVDRWWRSAAGAGPRGSEHVR